MKGLRIGFVVFAAAMITFGLSGMAFAFHSGGVAECMGCHNIHDGKSASALLQAGDISSTCASATCHGTPTAGSYHILTPTVTAGVPPLNKTPGGDFGWLLKSYSWVPRSGTTSTDAGQGHGHNIVAVDLPGYVAADNTTAPGGGPNLPAFSCADCHDQHGKLRRLSTGVYATTGAPIIGSGSYNTSVDPLAGQAVGTYRLLRGPGSPTSPGGVTFSSATALFKGSSPGSYNRAETGWPTKVAYGSGVSDWCATCHPDMHTGTTSKLTHPTNQGMGAPTVANYNSYLGSGLTGVSGFDTLVPFQMAATATEADLRAFSLDNGTATLAATSNKVMCLSCHRAHASGFEFMGRWNNAGEFIAVDGVWPGTDAPSTIANQPKYAQGRTTAETIAAYNGKNPMPYASYQRSLCNKCHAKD